MKQLVFSYNDSLISAQDLLQVTPQLKKEINQMNQAAHLQYDDHRASINLPFDTKMIAQVKTLITQKKKLHPRYMIVVGIGGSNLGTIAVQEAVLGKLYNNVTPGIQVLYADTVDSDLMNTFCMMIESALKKGENILINGISKSGHTTETTANFEILLHLLQRLNKEYAQQVVITSDSSSEFYALAQKENFDVLEIPKNIGGRYSVFSPVGLFPLGILGIDIDELIHGVQVMRERCLSPTVNENPAALGAAMIYLHKMKGQTIHDLFLFSPDLESVGRWYRQLMGESIGKEYTIKNKQVFEGITPTYSIGSTDLHSMAQLYLGGPFDKFTTFVRVEHNNSEVKIPNLPEYSHLVSGIQGKSLEEIMHAILDGVQAAFRKGKRPFVEVTLPDKSACSIGQFLQYKMMEIMYLGFLFKINPFDQPNVELYKQETRLILDRKKNQGKKVK